jgi:hypothetical protein
VNFFYEPDFYLFPVTVVTTLSNLHKQYATYPLHYKQVKAGLRVGFFNLGIGSYTFSPVEQFSYLDARLYYGGVGGNLHLAGLTLRPSFDLCLTHAYRKLPQKDWSNISFQPGLDVAVGPARLSLDGEFRKYLAKEPLDALHYRRLDFLIKAKLEFRAHFKLFNLYPFMEYDQRFVSGAVSPLDAQLLKAYKRFRAGLNVRFNII